MKGLNAVGGPQGLTALHMTVSQAAGNAELFRLLFEKQADCNVLSSAGDTPLHAAIWAEGRVLHASAAAISMIKSGRAKLDLRNAAQDTALSLSAARHLAPIMTQLVSAGADVNLANSSGNTAMHLACRPMEWPAGAKHEWSPQPAQVLLTSSKLRLDLSNKQGQTALTVLAATARWWESSTAVAASMVAQGTCSLNTFDDAGLTALHYSLGAGPAFGVHSGLGHGPALALHIISSQACDVNVISKDRAAEAAIHRCSQLGLPQVCTALLKRKADPNLADSAGQRPLHLAVSGGSAGHTAVAEQLIDCDECDANIVLPATGQTALLMVVLQCKASLVERLIKRGADPNIKDKKGDTALHAALRAAGEE